ncbi:primosomal protein N' [candidate division WOR-3 bacterium]|nr:primosomal protein N' [candidate division WOR-3 bacterium]
MEERVGDFNMYAEVALTQGNFTYLLNKEFEWVTPGIPVLVPFKNTIRMGFVVDLKSKTTLERVKPIKAVLYGEVILSNNMITLSLEMAKYYGVTQGVCIKHMMPPWVRNRLKNSKPLLCDNSVRDSIKRKKRKLHSELKDAISSHYFKTFLLFGKNRLDTYITSIEYTVAEGRSVIFLTPEIVHTPQSLEIMRENFGDGVVVMHSRLREREKGLIWEGIRRRRFNICFGSISAVFAPFPDLGLIIVDEEQSDAYKVGQRPWHNVRDVAVMRSMIDKIPCILGSATPSFESYNNSNCGKYRLIDTKREGNTISTKVVDMRDEKKFILSRYLVKTMRERFTRGEKVILFLPKKGYSRFCMCLDCGWIPYCPKCSVTLNYYRKKHMLRCHYCGYEKPAPDMCEKCRGIRFVYPGEGTERLEANLKSIFRDKRMIRMDTDILKTPGECKEAYRQFIEEGDILLGTQLVMKAPQLDSVTLVSIISCDALLSFPDFRTSERFFSQMLRAKAMIKAGEVVLQTYNPLNPIFGFIKDNDYPAFYSEEIGKRQDFGLPPYSHLIRILSYSMTRNKAKDLADKVAEGLKKKGYEIFGASPCPIEMIKGKWRYHILIKVNNPKVFFQSVNIPKGVSVEVDPQDML